jgi:hypothetical protein
LDRHNRLILPDDNHIELMTADMRRLTADEPTWTETFEQKLQLNSIVTLNVV